MCSGGEVGVVLSAVGYAPNHAFDEQIDVDFTGDQESLHAIRSFPFPSPMALLLSDGTVRTLAHSLHHVAIRGAHCHDNSIISFH